MILPAQAIRKIKPVSPFEERSKAHGMTYGLGPAGYDIRCAEDVELIAHGFKLTYSLEEFNMPNDVLAQVADKSTWARLGLAVQNTIIEPGWRGFLTLELANHGLRHISIAKGCPIAQIIFFRLEEPTEQPYSGKYQNQAARAVKAIHEDEDDGA